MNITIIPNKNGRITAKCETCQETADYPDKGLGRAHFAAWKTRHQH